MPTDKDFKRVVRARMRANDEPYSLARRAVLADSDLLVSPDLAAVLSARRRRRGWTIQEAADALSTSALKVGLLERGQAGVDERLASALAEAYDLSGDAFAQLARLAAARRETARVDLPRSGAFSVWADAPTLWIATLGRRTRTWRPKSWVTFIVDGEVAYLFEIDPDGADWVANLRAHPELWVWARTEPPRPARASEVTSEAEWRRARRLLAAKHPDHRDLVEWALPVALTATRPVP